MNLSEPSALANNGSTEVPDEPKDSSPDVGGPTEDRRAPSGFYPAPKELDGENEFYGQFNVNGQLKFLTLNSQGKMSEVGAEVKEPPKKRICLAENSVEQSSEETQERVRNDQGGENEKPEDIRKLWEIFMFSDQIYKM